MKVGNIQRASSKWQDQSAQTFVNERIGKAQARKNFLPLVTSIRRSRQPIEITEHGKPVAVLLDYESYQLLIKPTQSSEALRNLKGTVKISGDLEEARKEINAEFRKSFKRRSSLL